MRYKTTGIPEEDLNRLMLELFLIGFKNWWNCTRKITLFIHGQEKMRMNRFSNTERL